MAGHGERRVEELVMPGKEERRMLVEEWNNTKWDAGEGRGAETLVHLFEEQLKLTPAAVAVEQDGRHISYAELHRRANQLAHKLREAGVGSEVTVGLCLERTAEMVIAVLAILKAGGAYVPLDPGYPTQRLNYMLRDSGVTVLLSQSSLRNIEWAEERTIRVDIDAQAEPAGKARQQAPWTGVEPENAAYVIYTSGSTGRPKGVVVRHRSAAELAKWARRQYASEDLNGVLFGTSVCFDLSVFEMLVPLTAGGRVVIAENPLSLGQMAERGGVRLLNTVPSVIGELTRTTGIPAGVRTVNIAGEALKRTLVKRIYEQSGVERVVNLYGPTEDTTYSTFAVLRREDEGEVPIGRPVSNSQVYVLDEGMQPQPVSVAGEIYLGGEGLARGYCNQPGLTAERFVPDRLSGETGRRLYRTGDRGRWRADGQLEFLGRADRQVKLRGYRIEPGEIEAALSGHEAVSECAVLVAGQEAEKRQLVAFLVTRKSVKPPDVNELRRYLSTLLPEYMLPSVYSEVQALPLSSSGKLDRRALLNIHSSMNRPGPAQETNEVLLLHGDSTELYLKTLWEEILGISGVKSTDNFFAIGGHSLAAFAIAFRLAEYYKQPIPVRAVFQYPTISEISAFLRQAVMLSPPTSVIPINPGGELRPVFFIHPGGGWVNCYAPMARFLGTDRPIYGVQSYGFDEGQVPFRRIADMAAQYILDIEAIQPKGPYQIGGWCFGGTVAYEMARQWSRKGEVVSLLAIFDEVPISEPLKSGVSDQEIEAIEVDYLRSIAKELFPREFRISGVRVPAEQTLPAEEQLGVVMRRLKETGVLPRDITEQQYRRYLRVFASNMAAKNRYCCESFPGRITLFRSISGDLSSADRHDETGGWGRWARAGVDVHRCEMYHHDFVVREDNARELAEILQRCIENA